MKLFWFIKTFRGRTTLPVTFTTDYTDLHGLKKNICGNLGNLWFFPSSTKILDEPLYYTHTAKILFP